LLETILSGETDVAASSIAVNLPWEGLFNELHKLEEARRPSKAPQEPLVPRQQSQPAQIQHVNLSHILNEAAAAISEAQSRAEMLEQHVASVVESSKAQVHAAEAASKALERDVKDANDTIRALEVRAKTAEERVRELQVRLESARRVLHDTPVVPKTLVQRRPNPEVKGPQPVFEHSPVPATPANKPSFNRPLPS
jgi:chromosome segregation ATPase